MPEDFVAHMVFLMMLLLAALLFALVEIQIEGAEGWAKQLPTWRFENRYTRAVLGNRAITGYHLYVHLFVLTMIHLPFAFGVSWSWRLEARVLGFGVLFWILEDFLWFVLNPAYGLRGFNRERAWWHAPNWLGPMPRDYWVFIPLGVLLYVWSWR